MTIKKYIWLCRNSGNIPIEIMFIKKDKKGCGLYKDNKCSKDNKRCDLYQYLIKKRNEKTGLLTEV